jgi:hypothetical protein
MEAEGTRIPPTEGWKEAKVGSAVSDGAEGRQQENVVFARVTDHERFGHPLWLEAVKQGIEEVKAAAA